MSVSFMGEITAWDFQTAKELFVLKTTLRIMALKVSWPLVITCGINFNDGSNGVQIFNMKAKSLIRLLPCGYSSDVCIAGKFLVFPIFKNYHFLIDYFFVPCRQNSHGCWHSL